MGCRTACRAMFLRRRPEDMDDQKVSVVASHFVTLVNQRFDQSFTDGMGLTFVQRSSIYTIHKRVEGLRVCYSKKIKYLRGGASARFRQEDEGEERRAGTHGAIGDERARGTDPRRECLERGYDCVRA